MKPDIPVDTKSDIPKRYDAEYSLSVGVNFMCSKPAFSIQFAVLRQSITYLLYRTLEGMNPRITKQLFTIICGKYQYTVIMVEWK